MRINFQTDTIESLAVTASTASYASSAGDADTVDGLNTGNTSGGIPISNGTLNSNLNVDLLNGVHVKKLNILTWNMDTTATRGIVHGVVFDKIIGVSGLILNTAGTNVYPIGMGTDSPVVRDLNIVSISNTTLSINRKASGFFDSANFNAATGFVVIWYID